MSYPCFVHGEETDSSYLCEHCENDVNNGRWCPKHHIFHWDDESCPLCGVLAACKNPDLADKKNIIMKLCAER